MKGLGFGLAIFTFVLAGCSGGSPETDKSATPEGGAKKRVKIALLPKSKGIPYFSSCAEGAEEAAKELGNVDLTYDGPTDGSPEKAAAMVEKWTLQGYDAIAVSPNDPSVLGAAMKAAMDKGIKVLTWDADAAPGNRELFVNQATAEQIGYALVDTLAKDLGADPKGEVAIITAALTAANQNEWIKHIKARLPKYPNLKLIGVTPSNEDQKLAFQSAQDLIKAHPDLVGIFAISSTAFPGAAEGVKQAGKTGKVDVVGLSTPNDMRAYVKDGTIKSVVLWNTKDLGYLTIRAAEAMVSGKLKPTDATFDAGRLGSKKIVDKNLLLGDILVFTKENIDQFQF